MLYSNHWKNQLLQLFRKWMTVRRNELKFRTQGANILCMGNFDILLFNVILREFGAPLIFSETTIFKKQVILQVSFFFYLTFFL